MNSFQRLSDLLTLGSERPLRRLLGYYVVLAILVAVLFHFVPYFDRLLSGEHVQAITGSAVLQDALEGGKGKLVEVTAQSRLDLMLTTVLVMLSTLALMLPVSWVYMSARRTRDSSQHIAQTLIIMPLVVAGIVLVVRASLALAFSLSGIVAGMRFRTVMRDVRDTVYILLGIGVGLAAGVQSLTVAAVLSLVFNFVVLLAWRYDFGRNVLEPTAASQWAEPLGDLADNKVGEGPVPDRDLVLALSPKKAATLAKRFNRVRKILGPTKKKPRFNAILSVTTDTLSEAQTRVESVLDSLARRWRLDEVVTNEGKPSELYYLVGVRKSVTRDQLLTAIRQSAGERIIQADMEIGDAVAHERGEGQ
ncbi:MAG: hypothetical protein ACREK8_10665 [Gemmatimonadales bacterium]